MKRLYWLSGLFALFSAMSQSWGFIDYPYAVNFQTIRLPMLPLGESEMPAGAFSVRQSLRLINVWSMQADRFLIDGEEFQSETSLRYSVSANFQAGFSIPYQVRSGGFLDSSIEAFHRGFGLTQDHREMYPENRVNVSYEPFGKYYPLLDNNPLNTFLRNYERRNYPFKALPGLDQFFHLTLVPTQTASAASPGDPRVFQQYHAFHESGSIPSIFVGAQWKLPAGSGNMMGTPGVDTSFFLTLLKHLDSFVFQMGASYTTFAIRHYGLISLPGDQFVLRTSAVYLWNNFGFLLEYVYFTAPTRELGRLSRPGTQAAAGFTYTRENTKAVAAVVENFGNYGVTPDIGFLVSIETRP